MPLKRGSRFIPVEIKVLCAIGLFAQGNYERPNGRSSDLNLAQPTVSNCLRDVVCAFNHPNILTRFIHFPVTQDERDVIIESNRRYGLPGVLGYIDGTLVSIVPPSGPDKHVYRTRKGHTGLNMQIVCNSNLYIMNANARFPGSACDPYIYRMSPVRAVMRQAFQESPCWLLGDSAYPHEPWLQLPLLHAEQGTPEYKYTPIHCKGRNCVERCIGVLKGRWRCLLKDRTLHYRPTRAAQICNSCVVLHNYLVSINAPNPRPVYENLRHDDPDDPDMEEEVPILQHADDVRRHLIAAAQVAYDRNH